MKNFLLFIFATFLTFAATAQSEEACSTHLTAKQTQLTQQLFQQKGEIYFSFEIPDRSAISTVTRVVSIDNVKNNTVFAYANQREFECFLTLGYNWQILANPNETATLNTSAKPSELLDTWNTYPTYEAYEALMAGFVADYPNLCRLVNIGTLASGRKLLVLKITDNPDVREDEPQFLYTSTMHGDETAGYVGMLHLIDYLLSHYNTDTRTTNLVNNMEIWINPLANPDGTYRAGNNTVSGATRANANNVDLNRNYPDFQDGAHPDGNAWQPETVAFMAFADTMNFVMAANFHGGAEVFNYPWDTWATLPADTDWWLERSVQYVDTLRAHSPASYFTDVAASGYTNGYAWYEVNGGRQDYMNWFKHCREVTIELSSQKLLAESQLLNNWNYNYRSWLNLLEESLHGVRGIVKDACTGQPLVAKIEVEGHDFDESHVFSGLPLGNYHRPIAAGTYTLIVSAPGYVSQTISGISVTENAPAVVLNIDLAPAVPVAAFEVSEQVICGATAQFTDLTGSATSWTWQFGDGSIATDQHPAHTWTNSGDYTITLAVSNCAGSDTLVQAAFVSVHIPEAPLVPSATVCGSGTATLTATNPAGAINWYSTANATTPLFTGPTFTTPQLNNSATYYAEQDFTGPTQYGGPQDYSIGTGGFYTGSAYHYLSFDAEHPFILRSVWVNAGTTANRTVQLRNSAGTVLQSITLNVPSGQHRIDLNFEVPAGDGLQLGIAGNNNLYRNLNGASYPYPLGSAGAITGNSAASGIIYYYFYDWEIVQPCVSPRVAVDVSVAPIPQMPILTASNDTLFSSAPTGNQWYGGSGGLIPGATSATYVVPFPGEYYVVVSNEFGCTAESIPVTFLPTGTAAATASTGVQVWPNPTRNSFVIDLSQYAAPSADITVCNALGQPVWQQMRCAHTRYTVGDAAYLPSGLYYVVVTAENGAVSRATVAVER